MEKERGGLWPDPFGYNTGVGVTVWSFFFLYTWILLLVDQTSFLAVLLKGILASIDETFSESDYVAGCIFISFCVAFVLLICWMFALNIPEHKPGKNELIDDVYDPQLASDCASCYLHFICGIGLPFYLIYRGLRSVKTHWLLDLAVIAVSLLLPWKTVAVILVYVYGVFSALLCTDYPHTSAGASFLRLLISCALMFFVCFRNLFIA